MRICRIWPKNFVLVFLKWELNRNCMLKFWKYKYTVYLPSYKISDQLLQDPKIYNIMTSIPVTAACCHATHWLTAHSTCSDGFNVCHEYRQAVWCKQWDVPVLLYWVSALMLCHLSNQNSAPERTVLNKKYIYTVCIHTQKVPFNSYHWDNATGITSTST